MLKFGILMEIGAKYTPQQIESKWYDYWIRHNFFHSTPDGREPYTIVIPPPNVTGVLHMGHMLNETIQDVLVRRARMQGKNACWVPGTDHASIATEAKVVQKLKADGIDKNSLTREEFKTRLAVERETRRHHPEPTAQTRRFVRLGAYQIHDGPGAERKRHQSIRRPV